MPTRCFRQREVALPTIRLETRASLFNARAAMRVSYEKTMPLQEQVPPVSPFLRLVSAKCRPMRREPLHQASPPVICTNLNKQIARNGGCFQAAVFLSRALRSISANAVSLRARLIQTHRHLPACDRMPRLTF